MKFIKFSITILAFILFISCQRNGQITSGNYSDLTSKMDSLINQSNFNGIMLLTKDSTTIYSKFVGYADLENKTPITLDDQFVIGSISKQITTVLLLIEYEKGYLKLNDKINKYLPDINQTWANDVTIHQLLIHTHGIVDLDKPLEFKEGSQFHYSQLGYELIAKILEKVTRKSFKTLSSELFEQYGLTKTFHPDNKRYKHLVKGYEEDETGILTFTPNSLYNYAAAGSFISNGEDLNRWNELLYSGKLVNEKTLTLMKTKYATRIHPIFGTIEYGYGLLFKDGEENLQIGALGYAPGFVSACYFYPQTNMNLIVLGNMANNLDNFQMTFKVHTDMMALIKKQTAKKLSKK